MKRLHISGSSSSGTSSPTPLSLAASPDLVLEEGMSVLVSKELGVVRFIGETEFAPGIWLGVELRKPSEYVLLKYFKKIYTPHFENCS